jgi:hypothetical protein
MVQPNPVHRPGHPVVKKTTSFKQTIFFKLSHVNFFLSIIISRLALLDNGIFSFCMYLIVKVRQNSTSKLASVSFNYLVRDIFTF